MLTHNSLLIVSELKARVEWTLKMFKNPPLESPWSQLSYMNQILLSALMYMLLFCKFLLAIFQLSNSKKKHSAYEIISNFS